MVLCGLTKPVLDCKFDDLAVRSTCSRVLLCGLEMPDDGIDWEMALSFGCEFSLNFVCYGLESIFVCFVPTTVCTVATPSSPCLLCSTKLSCLLSELIPEAETVAEAAPVFTLG